MALSDERGGEDGSMSIINDDLRLSLENPHIFGGGGRDRNGSVDYPANRIRKGTDDSDVLIKEKMKLEEEEKIAENGPYLKPGIVDHICVVGPESGFVVPKNDSRRGWLGERKRYWFVFSYYCSSFSTNLNSISFMFVQQIMSQILVYWSSFHLKGIM